MFLLLAACTDYELSPSDDAAPGDERCEAPGPWAVDVDPECVTAPTVGTFTPVIEWQWTENPVHPGYHDIMATPAVGNLGDDDGDGDVDDADVPDVVFAAFANGAYTSPGALVAIRGDTGATLWSVTSAGGYHPHGSGGVAIGDLEGDGRPEVCVAGADVAVICLRGDGSFLWAAGAEVYGYGAPTLVDLNGDGRSEVLLGRQAFSAEGTLLWTGSGGYGWPGIAVPVDLNGDGRPEVLAGNTAYRSDGSVLWTDGGGEGANAVADFDLDGVPEVVKVSGGTVFLASADGSPRWSVAVPGGGGGPPTVADFDGDGAPEVGVAGASYYSVIDTDGTPLWSMPVSDYSSSVTGSSVFDFEGDGDAEVVYADEHTLWVFEGRTGAVLMQQEGHASGTLFEYPLIADVDRDGSTEIIVPSNKYAYSGWNGITVIGDADASWAPARPVWNQHAYNIVNIEDDGGVPSTVAEPWSSSNSFRAGGTPEGPAHWLADLVVGEPEACTLECEDGLAVLWVPVENRGPRAAEGAVLSLRRGGTLVDHAEVGLVEPGGTVLVGPFRLERGDWGGGELVAVVDEAGVVDECDEEDNTRSLGGWVCPVGR